VRPTPKCTCRLADRTVDDDSERSTRRDDWERASPRVRDVAIQRMDHVGVVVDDLEAAISFFVELGMELDGGTTGVGRPRPRARSSERSA
jgi:hypothetical protein